MARTKQTARNSTGASAKSQLLGPPPTRLLQSHTALSRNASCSPRVTPDVEMDEEPTLVPEEPAPAPDVPVPVPDPIPAPNDGQDEVTVT